MNQITRALLIAQVFFPVLSAAQEPANNSCHYYEALEKLRGCSNRKDGESRYLSDYAARYCKKFIQAESLWGSELQRWSRSVRLCLQEMLAHNPRRIVPCRQLESFAFDSHAICYKQYGFCALSLGDKSRVASLIQAEDIFLKTSITQILNVTLECGVFASDSERIFFERVREGVSKQSGIVMAHASELFRFAPVSSRREEYFNDALSLLIAGEKYERRATVVDAYIADAQFAISRGDSLSVLDKCWEKHPQVGNDASCTNIRQIKYTGNTLALRKAALLYDDLDAILVALKEKYPEEK